ncbi:YpiF family protein [Desertibacillus haloalkaliphilus]|uniref:YpiF family protein n=1 Tax=Desertibacillus haloalkaliphilus TaxID=1328930 RepID=UPI001C2805D6|nr:YpiF family protein [Desertibacillus haloalkaliphilus]MBU8907261.1 YpiF family protein [Desertibacillus haloalkaliphilus]
MKWQAIEIDTYLQAKEYVDTAIIPLVPISWEKEVKGTVAMGEFIMIMADELERQFRGRVIQFPAFSYLKSEPLDDRVQRLECWYQELTEHGVKHVVYITSDHDWKTAENKLSDMLLWLPTIPLEHMDHQYKVQTVSDQIKQLLPIMTNKWQNDSGLQND